MGRRKIRHVVAANRDQLHLERAALLPHFGLDHYGSHLLEELSDCDRPEVLGERNLLLGREVLRLR